MKSICVFAGSAIGSKPSYSKRAHDLGLEIAKRNYSMVYGGGNNGLMGVLADAALKGGAKVTGIITEKLNDIEVGHDNLSTLEIVPTMHERKLRMAYDNPTPPGVSYFDTEQFKHSIDEEEPEYNP